MTTKTFSVLLIDDDETTTNIFRLVMQHYDVTLATASDAQSGLDFLKEYRPDAIVIDIFMPGMDGYQTLKAIRGNRLADGAVCIATTSYHNSDTPTTLSEYGFDGYIPKPLDANRIVPYLEQAINQHH